MHKNPKLVMCFGLALLLLGQAGSAQAQSVRLLGDFRDWSAYATSDSAGRVCFAITRPKQTDPVPDGLTDSYLYITHRPAESVRNEINLVAGYVFSTDSTATGSVGGREFQMFTSGDAAWLENPSESADVTGSIRAGTTLVIEGTSDKGIKVRQTFSLSGATAASRAIDSECR